MEDSWWIIPSERPIQRGNKLLPKDFLNESNWETLRNPNCSSNFGSLLRPPSPRVKRRLCFDTTDECEEGHEINRNLEHLRNKVKNERSWATSSPIGSEESLRVPSDISSIPKMREVKLMSSKKANDSAADIIVLDDDSSCSSNKTPSKKSSSKSRHVQFDSPKEFCSYHGQPVTEHDYKTLAEDEYLNDNIINFYLTWLFQNLSDKHKEMIHIYSSHFYTRLKSKPHKKDQSGQTKAEKTYNRVKGWTKKINIFDKRMLIFPICDEYHWFLVIVCNPGHVLSQSREKDFEAKRSYQQKYGEARGSNPFIMVLDSLGGSHSTAVSKIRQYLTFEHIEKKKVPKNFGKEKMGEKHPPIPLQPNSCDCGLFLLHYVELIFKDPEVFLGAMLPDLSKWFNTTDIDFKREDIALLIQRLSNNNGNNRVRFPRIKFPARRKDRGDSEALPTIDVDEEDTPLASRRADPRLRKVKGGSLGELLAAKQNSSRSTRFTGTYLETPSSPGIITKTSPPSSPSSPPRPRTVFDSPISIQFGVKKKVHSPQSPDLNDFKDKGASKRFTLKRHNEDTNPETIQRRSRHERSEDKPASSKREMFDFLMNASSSKKKV